MNSGLEQISFQTEEQIKSVLTCLEEEAVASLEQVEGTYAKAEFHYIDVTFETVHFSLDYGILSVNTDPLRNQEDLTLPLHILIDEDMEVRDKVTYIDS